MAIVASWSSPQLLAQTSNDQNASRNWRLQGLRSGYCVRFLIEPEEATKKQKPGLVPIAAQQDSSIHPALNRVIRNQPEFAAWVPSRVCFYFMDAVDIGKHRIRARDRRSSQMIGVWTLAARERQGGARRDIALELYSSRSGLLRAAEIAQVRMQEADAAVSRLADTTADSYSIKVRKNLLVWQGRATGDSSRVEQSLEERWWVNGLRTSVGSARLLLKPAWSWSLVGSLRVEGKGDLAQALKASPIRFVGPLYRGGSGELRFSR